MQLIEYSNLNKFQKLFSSQSSPSISMSSVAMPEEEWHVDGGLKIAEMSYIISKL